MENALISIVIPIYNVEAYLDRCVESVVNQTYHNLEIILVDDGSPDGCPQICDDWAKKDGRIKVIHKQNEGLGMARNTGIENATGEYICFFDSDDYIAPTLIEKAYNVAQRECADIVNFGCASVNTMGVIYRVNIPQVEKLVYSGEIVREYLLPAQIGQDLQTGKDMGLTFTAWSMMFAMKLIQEINWRFVSEREIISEDVYSLLALYEHVQKVVILPEALYYHCDNETSLTRSYRKDRYERIKYFYIKCIELCQECGYTKEVIHRCVEAFLGNTIGAMKLEVACCNYRNAITRLRQIIDDDTMQSVMREKKGDKVNYRKRLLYWAVRNRRYILCYLLLAGRNGLDKNK